MRLLIGVACLVFSGMAHADTAWSTTHNDLGLTNRITEVATPDEVIEEVIRKGLGRTGKPEELVIIEEIVNLGEKLWKVVEKNKPVVNVKYNYANALPRGLKSAEELESFSPIQFRSFRMHGENGFGMTVYDLTYTLVHRYGGAYQGKGRYLDAVTVVPHKLDVLWGYTVNFNVDRISTVNVSTAADPVASLVLEMKFHVSTVLKSSQFNGVYEFRGDSAKVSQIP